jgi:predicted acylesterase/phospholipase RssA
MKNYNTIVIAGGGMKGFAILGVLQYLYQYHILKNIKKYIGTSVGSMLSVLMILEYQPVEISLYLLKSPYLKKFTICNIFNGMNGKGVINFDYFEIILKELILKKIDKIPTFQELYEKYPIEINMITFNYSLNKEELLSRHTTPNLNIVEAMRMSSNVPFLFGNYKNGDYFYFDGFITNIFPIDKIDKDNDIVLGISTLQDRWKKETNTLKLNNLKIIWNLFLLPFFKIQRVSCNDFIEHCDVINITSNLGSFFDVSLNTTKILDFFSNGYSIAKDSLFFATSDLKTTTFNKK